MERKEGVSKSSQLIHKFAQIIVSKFNILQQILSVPQCSWFLSGDSLKVPQPDPYPPDWLF